MEKFQRELCSLELIDELIPIFVEHDRAVSCLASSAPFSPDFDLFLQAEKAGKLRIFLARDENTEEILGYSIFLVSHHLHRKSLIQAEETALFIRPRFRGFGPRFLTWTEEQLREEKVQVVVRHVKPKFDMSALLQRKGYEMRQTAWFKCLEEEKH